MSAAVRSQIQPPVLTRFVGSGVQAGAVPPAPVLPAVPAVLPAVPEPVELPVPVPVPAVLPVPLVPALPDPVELPAPVEPAVPVSAGVGAAHPNSRAAARREVMAERIRGLLSHGKLSRAGRVARPAGAGAGDRVQHALVAMRPTTILAGEVRAMKNPVSHFEIYANDPKALGRFYTSVFDWKVEPMPTPGDGEYLL